MTVVLIKTELPVEDGCQRSRPMTYCKVCGTYLHCKPDDKGPWIRRDKEVTYEASYAGGI
jgi:hypothetical protein